MFNTAVTLISDPAAPALDAPAYEAALEAMASAGVERWTVEFLSPGAAADFKVAWDDRAALADAVGAALRDHPVDVVVQPLLSRRKRLLIADMDSTIIAQECLDELADFAGLKAEIAAVTERAMRGDLDFESALRSRVAMLKGLPEARLDETFRTRISLTAGAKTLVATMKANGARTVLVSGGFLFFVSRVATSAGFDYFEANSLLIENGALAGEVGQPILGREAKQRALIRHAKERGVPLAETLAVGDGANDLAMLKSAGLGVAYHAKPAVAAAAAARINHGDLTALLFLQGYADKEFIR